MSEEKLDKGETFMCPHCGTIHPLVTSICPETSKTISPVHKFSGRLLEGKYRIEGVVGEGGMGVVYEGRQENMDRKVAVKFFNPRACTDPGSVDCFIDEAKYAASIGHANIVNVLNFGYIDSAIPYMVMEYLEGESLGQLLLEERVLAVERAVDITCMILDALHAVHAGNIVHLDLKPENVFLARQTGGGEIVKLLDFGISRLMKSDEMSSRLRGAGRVYGTPYYASPEQIEGKENIDHRADIYSVGVLLYEMLTGRLPFRSKSYEALLVEVISKPPPNPRELTHKIPSDMVNVILKTLQKKPEDRFRDAMEMAEELKRIRTMLDENVFADESAREERRTGSDKGAARRRKKRVSVTGYSIVMPDGAIGPDSPYSRAKRRRPSSPSASRKRGRGLSEEEEGKLVSASSEILEILKDVKTPPPLPAAAAEDVSECDETKDPRATPLAIPAADLPDDTQDEEKEEKPGGGPGIDTDEIDKNW